MEDRFARKEIRGTRLVNLFWAITPRQRFVLYLFVQGWEVPDIADHLEIKEKTVKTYMSQIVRKADTLGEELDHAVCQEGR